MLVIHKNGQYIGWRSFNKNGSGTLLSYMQGGDNTPLTSAVVDSDVSSIWNGERLVRTSTDLYANRCVQYGGSCTSGSTGSPDGDRIGSVEATPSNNNGGALGNWHDMNYCCSSQSYGSGKSCNGSAFRTVSEAQAGWGSASGQNGTFGSDSFAPMNNTTSNTGCSGANWAGPSGYDYDYALFIGP